MKARAILILLILSCTTHAIELDKVSHFGISYAIQTGMYGLIKTNTKLTKPKAVLLSLVLTVLIASSKEVLIDSKPDIRDVQANVLGATAASATILTFDF